MLADIRESLQNVMIDIEQHDLYDTLIHLRGLSFEASKSSKLAHQFDHYHSICFLSNKNEEFSNRLREKGIPYLHLSQALNLKDDHYSSKKPTLDLILSILLALPSFPGIVCFYPMFLFTEWTQLKIVKDPLFINSIRVVFWAFITQVWIIILLLITQLIVHNFTLSLLIVSSVVVSGIIALKWSEFRKRRLSWRHKQNVKNTMFDKYQKWSLLRAELLEILSLKNYR